MKLIYRIKPPCPRCPYTLGQVQTLVNPCPQCKAGNYSAYEHFKHTLNHHAHKRTVKGGDA